MCRHMIGANSAIKNLSININKMQNNFVAFFFQRSKSDLQIYNPVLQPLCKRSRFFIYLFNFFFCEESLAFYKSLCQ